MEKDNIMDNLLLIPSTAGDLLSRLRKLTDVNEIVKKHYINPETFIHKRNVQKYLRGPFL